ncbi:efflux RND transporter periplasmic adaptor subunit [Serratia marcescens]|uniref:efflux RND transporter periplasmic adaptor subunit n=1 Tax=Serratia marcescens TaxID=615 RepID=UPI002380499D|nr:HlyD family secretion protein [Serratia marcescens]
MKTTRNIYLTLLIFVLGCISVYAVYSKQVYGLWTRDGRVRSDVIALSSEVNGYVESVYVHDNQPVKKGQLLFVVDEREYKIIAAESYHTMQSKKVEVSRLKNRYNRRKGLAGEVISQEDVENAALNYAMALANYSSAVEENRKAELALSKTRIYAPTDGYITNLLIHPGDYLNAGKNIVSIVKKDSFYVYAYFQEDQIQRIKPNQKAKIILLNKNSQYEGRVDSISRGIIDSSDKSSTGELHDINPTFEWVRLPMRIPVRIVIDPHEKGYEALISGMTCTVEIVEEQ